ncbi:MAG: hypothetical protein BACD_00203 [Bacteroides rodentium]
MINYKQFILCVPLLSIYLAATCRNSTLLYPLTLPSLKDKE